VYLDPDRDIDPEEHAFAKACDVLRRISTLPASRRDALQAAHRRHEDAALKLIYRSDVVRRHWLAHAALSLSPRLALTFGPGVANAILIEWKSMSWEDIALHATPDHIEALCDAGVQFAGLHDELMKSAFTPGGVAFQPFMERHIRQVWSKKDPLEDLTTMQISDHADFLTRYLTRMAEVDRSLLEFWMVRYARRNSGRNLLILGVFGVEQQPGDPFAGAFGRMIADQSSHRRMQVEAWRRDPASLLRNRDALDWAHLELNPHPA
jgi:hypothetical protein